MSEPIEYPTSLGVSTADTISLFGRDLPSELIGQVSFGRWPTELIMLREPTPQQSRVFEAVLVALADHGFTPTAIAARLTYLSAPDAIQGALAAGLLGGGSRFLGVSEDTGAFLADALRRPVRRAADRRRRLGRAGAPGGPRRRAAGGFVPGLGHHLHKNGDPRTPVIIGIARDEGTYGPHLALFEAIGRVAPEVLGKALAAERCRRLRRGAGRPRHPAASCCAASSCWRAAPACSVTSPRRCATPSRGRSSTSVESHAVWVDPADSGSTPA